MVLRYDQLQKVVGELNTLFQGAQLQDIILTESYLFLQFYRKGPLCLGLHLQANEPSLGIIFDEIKKKKSLVKPIVLFLRAHAKDKFCKRIWLEEAQGRVVFLRLENQVSYCEIKLILIPRALNVIINTEDKKISLFPVKELPAALIMPNEAIDFDVNAYLDQWVARYSNPQKANPAQAEQQQKRKEKNLAKKKQAIANLQTEHAKLLVPWASVGDYLKSYQSVEVPEDWMGYVRSEMNLAQNIQNCFEQHKIQEKRKAAIEEKILHLQKELEQLETDQPLVKPGKAISVGTAFLKKAEAKGRKLTLNDKVEAVVGKTAQDNLALLRKAQAWDLWLHLKDYPGAHAIIRRPRNIEVDLQDILKVGEWVLRESKSKVAIEAGDRFDLIVVECRFVKPIKGDKLGRVIYQNEKVHTLRVN